MIPLTKTLLEFGFIKFTNQNIIYYLFPIMSLSNEEIIKKHGGFPQDCNCEKCQSMCKTPCVPTYEDFLNIIKSNNQEIIRNFLPTNWSFGRLIGTHKGPVFLMAPKFVKSKGCCVFFENGLCKIHESGLKPLDGKLAHCSKYRTFQESPLSDIIDTWDNEEQKIK